MTIEEFLDNPINNTLFKWGTKPERISILKTFLEEKLREQRENCANTYFRKHTRKMTYGEVMDVIRKARRPKL